MEKEKKDGPQQRNGMQDVLHGDTVKSKKMSILPALAEQVVNDHIPPFVRSDPCNDCSYRNFRIYGQDVPNNIF